MIGCAFVVFEDEQEIYSEQIRLQSFCSVFQAELLAILKAVEWCVGKNDSAQILNDSQAALTVHKGQV